jgi:hypothetical protein
MLYWTKHLRSGFAALLILAILMLTGFPRVVQAQEGVTLTIEGTVTAINGNTWLIGDVTVEVNTSTLLSYGITVGSRVRLVAVRDSGGKLVARTILLIATPVPSIAPPTLTPIAPPATLTPPPVALTSTPAATPTGGSATPVGTLTRPPITYVTIIIEGPIESINVKVIVVYGWKIRLRDDDPIRLKVKVGDWVRIRGNYGRGDDDTILIIAIIVIIIETPRVIIIVPPGSGGGGGGDDDDDD